MRSLLDEVTAEDALPWLHSEEDRKPIGIYLPASRTELIPRGFNPDRYFEPKLYTFFKDNCPVTCECRGNLMPGHDVANMIDGDTLVDRPPPSDDSQTSRTTKTRVPVVQTILYYDVPDMERYKTEKKAANEALTQLEKTRAERRSKSSTKRSQMRALTTTGVKEEPEEPEILYVQARRPARGYIPVQSLLGPFDIEAMEPAPPKARIITMSPSTAAATLPTPPMSTTSTVDGAFAEAQSTSTSGSTASPTNIAGPELQFASPESEPMPIDQPPDVDKPEPSSSAMDVDPPPEPTTQSANTEAGLLPPIDMDSLPELSSPAISVQNPLPFGYQPARHWDTPPAQRPGPEHAETSTSGSSSADGWQPPSDAGRQGREILTLGFGEVRSIGIQRPAGRFPPPPSHSNAHPYLPEHGFWQPNQPFQQHNYPPSEALDFSLPSSTIHANEMSMMSFPTPYPPHPLPLFPSSSSAAPGPLLRQQNVETKPSRTRPQPPTLTVAGTKAEHGQWTNVANGLPSPAKSPRKAHSKSPDNDEFDLDFKPNKAASKPRTLSPTKPKPKTKELSPSSDTDAKDKKAKKRFQCAVKGCPATFTRRNDVDRHMKSASAHRNYAQEWAIMQSNQGPALNPFRCEKCNRILSRADSAKRHMESGACGKRELPSEQAIGGRRDTPRR